MNRKPAPTDQLLNCVIVGLTAVILFCCCPALAWTVVQRYGRLLTASRDDPPEIVSTPTPGKIRTAEETRLRASDPSQFQMASGRLQMVEFFAFW